MVNLNILSTLENLKMQRFNEYNEINEYSFNFQLAMWDVRSIGLSPREISKYIPSNLICSKSVVLICYMCVHHRYYNFRFQDKVGGDNLYYRSESIYHIQKLLGSSKGRCPGISFIFSVVNSTLRQTWHRY